MFRQVVVYQWAEGASPEAKQAFRDALDALREIPELLAMTCGDDAGHFDDNFDFVVVADFADFDSADEIFVVGNYGKVSPVKRIESRDLQPGPLFRRARQLYWDFAHSK